MKKLTVKFRVNNKFWMSPGRIVFYEDNFQLIFLWKTKLIVNYTQILSIKKTRYFLENCINISTTDNNVDLIAGLKFRKLVEQFKSLGFNIEG